MLIDLRSSALLVLAGAMMVLTLQARSADRDALRKIVQQQCVAHWLRQHDPAPCERVYLPATRGELQGYALLADRKGGAHLLLIPTRTLAGIESPALLEPGTPNYFAAAWRARERIDATLGHSVGRDKIGLAVNSRYSRGQDQLHIHIECLSPQLYQRLQAMAAQLHAAWSPFQVGGWRYQALRVDAQDLDNINPFELLANRMPQARGAMGVHTLVVAGMQFREGPGFVVLSGRAVPGGETLLDSRCAIARR